MGRTAKCVLIGWCVSIGGGTAIAGCYVCGETTCSISGNFDGDCRAGSIAKVCGKARRSADPGEPGKTGENSVDVPIICTTYTSNDPAAWREDPCDAREPDTKPGEGWDPLQADCDSKLEEGHCCDINMDLIQSQVTVIGTTKNCPGEDCTGDTSEQ